MSLRWPTEGYLLNVVQEMRYLTYYLMRLSSIQCKNAITPVTNIFTAPIIANEVTQVEVFWFDVILSHLSSNKNLNLHQIKFACWACSCRNEMLPRQTDSIIHRCWYCLVHGHCSRLFLHKYSHFTVFITWCSIISYNI